MSIEYTFIGLLFIIISIIIIIIIVCTVAKFQFQNQLFNEGKFNLTSPPNTHAL